MRIELRSADTHVLPSRNPDKKNPPQRTGRLPKNNSLYRLPKTGSTEGLCATVGFLFKFGVPSKLLKRASLLANQNGTSGAHELIAFNGIGEQDFYRLLARHLGVRFIEADDIHKLLVSTGHTHSDALQGHQVWADLGVGPPRALIAPNPNSIPKLEKMVSGANKSHRMAITAPSEMRIAVLKQFGETLSSNAINDLATQKSDYSAKNGARAWQGALAVIFILTIAASQLLVPGPGNLAIHILMSSTFVLCAGIRLLALVNYEPLEIGELIPTPDSEKPIYSVMVPLNDEAAVIPDLVTHLKKLRWPHSKLEIKIVCEADDLATLTALERETLDSRFEIIRVPPSEPRTKPKALCFALGLTKGRYITLYDAEDRPHPEQLLEAYGKFQQEDEKLGCLQAPLKIANASRNFWTSMFHFEYAALFGGLLPWLARRQSPVLLGGTSNHFCRDALEKVGAWDPFNVTEDADLGLRLWRYGYRTDMITRPTLEDAPTDFSTWHPQRTRWFKGWMQTWIVHMRKPHQLRANMDMSSFAIIHILLIGTIASALLHPFVFIKALQLTFFVQSQQDTAWVTWIMLIDWATILISYVGFMALCWQTRDKGLMKSKGYRILLTPIYWLAITFAAWRGFWQLCRDPFLWEKTPHSPHEN